MKLFTTEDINAIERQSLAHDLISEFDLAERAGNGAACEIASRWNPQKRTVVFAGPGTNGAYALMTAQALIQRGFHPLIYLFNIGGNTIGDLCRRCRDLLKANAGSSAIEEVITKFNIPELSASDLVIDGLFGQELREPLTGGFMSLVRYINESQASVVSIDVPSGMCGDWNHNVTPRNVVQATLTLAIQYPRLPFFIADFAPLAGDVRIVDIGLSREAAENRRTNFHLIEEAEVRTLLHQRPPFCSKADFGSACIVAGSYGMAGAAVLAARGALRAGAGKVTLYGPAGNCPVAQTAVPEAMYLSDRDNRRITSIDLPDTLTAVGVGPGIDTDESTVDALDSFLKHSKRPLVLDADALNCIARRPALLQHLPMLSVLTPHAGEFDRLFGPQPSHEARLLKAVEAARQYNILILLKGHYTALVRLDGKIYFNSTGTPAMATPGSGDVLTGILTALIAQGYKPEVASIIAAYIHGRAGELAAATQGTYGVTASDIAVQTGPAIKSILEPDNSSAL